MKPFYGSSPNFNLIFRAGLKQQIKEVLANFSICIAATSDSGTADEFPAARRRGESGKARHVTPGGFVPA